METGRIQKLFCDKEYGTIRMEDQQEVHFHKHCLLGITFDQLKEGQQVVFFTQPANKGLLGFNVHFV